MARNESIIAHECASLVFGAPAASVAVPCLQLHLCHRRCGGHICSLGGTVSKTAPHHGTPLVETLPQAYTEMVC